MNSARSVIATESEARQEAIQFLQPVKGMDCFAMLAMTVQALASWSALDLRKNAKKSTAMMAA